VPGEKAERDKGGKTSSHDWSGPTSIGVNDNQRKKPPHDNGGKQGPTSHRSGEREKINWSDLAGKDRVR